MTKHTSYTFGLVPPNGQGSQRLGPGRYSLSARSNIPFVRLIGKSIDKIFTWGEIVEVPQGELAGVINASFHAGDIFINGGCDYDNRPARITVPVQYPATQLIGLTTYWAPSYPADVRLARRAYLAFAASAPELNSLVSIVGLRLDGSHNTANEVLPPFQGSGYFEDHTIPALTALGLIPLGSLANLGDDTRPHALLTTATPFVESNVVLENGAALPNAYYVMEY